MGNSQECFFNTCLQKRVINIDLPPMAHVVKMKRMIFGPPCELESSCQSVSLVALLALAEANVVAVANRRINPELDIPDQGDMLS